MKIRKISTRTMLLLAASSFPFAAQAQTDDTTAANDSNSNDIIVTATRRAGTVQDVPINISAIGGDQLEEQGLGNIRDVAATVPGVYILEQGNRSGTPIVFRGLNATGLGSFDGDNSGGGSVATYVGEIPLYVDLRLNDIERVEFLLGPQGTLYGAGTLGGAIRYIPNRPKLGEIGGEIRASAYTYESGKGISSNTGMTINLPFGDSLAFRGSIDFLNDRGFIDYPYAVQQIGVSNPDTNPANTAAAAANFKRLEDVNTDETLSARAALRFNPSATFDATLTYHYQETNTDGRQFSQTRLTNFPVAIGRYESALRVPEPKKRETHLVSLEAELDLGFAKLVSATGYSEYRDKGNRDQTDLLITLEYSYEQFPNFTAFTEEISKEETFTQELRLVSQFDGPFSFIVGGFYNKQKTDNISREFTPGYDQFAVANFGGVGPRPDSLEYIAPANSDLREIAAFGELTYEITDAWQITAGGRFYDYDLKSNSAVDFPLLETVFNGRGPNSIVLNFVPANQADNGFLFKFNTSYQFTPDVLMYATVSQGFRIGNSNGLTPCVANTQQNVCGLPNELEYTADTTTNYEVGLKTQWFDGRLTLNGAIYYIDWKDPQVASATQSGSSPITINGAGAKSQGIELFGSAKITDRLSIRGAYSYTNAELTALSPSLLTATDPVASGSPFGTVFVNGQKGDRLPGSPEHQGSLFVDYEFPVADEWDMKFSWGFTAHSDVLTRTGGRAGGLTLPGFSRHNVSVRLEGKGWAATLFADNLFNSFGETGVRSTPLTNKSVADINGAPVYTRSFGTFVAPPRRIGLRISKKF